MTDATHDRHRLVIIGGLLVDDIAIPVEKLQPRSSNPVNWQHRLGGGAANVAQVVAQQIDTVLIASTGDDDHGKLLASLLAKQSVSASLVVWTNHQSDRYTAVLDSDNELYIGLADAQLAEKMNWLDIESRLPGNAPEAVVIDANLSPRCLNETVTGLKEKYSQSPTLFALAVSPVKARRLLPLASNIDVLLCNRREAAALSGLPSNSDIQHIADGLQAQGFARFGITDGTDAIMVQDNESRTLIQVPHIGIEETVNGAGDALAGASIAGILQGYALEDAVGTFGIPAARAILSGDNSPPSV